MRYFEEGTEVFLNSSHSPSMYEGPFEEISKYQYTVCGNKATTNYSKALVETDNMTLLLDVLHCQVQSYYRTTAALQHRLAQLFAADKAPQVTSH